ncbi:MAG: sodium:calcium antiporter [Candidatus Paceibacterota bacterium]
MTPIINILIFVSSCGLLYISGEIMVNSLVRLSKYFGLKEFVVAFFVMAVASSIPNLLIGITSALKGIPELSLGDIMGNNLIDLTIAVGLAVLFSPTKEISAESKTIQSTSMFTLGAALLPIILIVDGILSRADGIILISFFFIYIFWLFSKKERFSKAIEGNIHPNAISGTKEGLKDAFKIFFGTSLLFIAAQGIVLSSTFLATSLGLPLVIVGSLIIAFGSALPEVYFAIYSARREETFMILGNLMGAVIIPASLVLGIVTLISPINVTGLGSFFMNRIFLIIAILAFFMFTRTQEKITRKESYVLIAIYLIFVITTLIKY